jgi:hypothetical protein
MIVVAFNHTWAMRLRLRPLLITVAHGSLQRRRYALRAIQGVWRSLAVNLAPCDVYVDLDTHAACRRALFAVRLPTFGTRDTQAAVVVGRVSLEGAVTYVSSLSGIPELRAASGQVLELYIMPLRHQPDAHLLVEPLTARDQVPVCYGLPAHARIAVG